MSSPKEKIFASITFDFPNEEKHSFQVTHTQAIDVNDVHPDAKRCNTFYYYSGRHDDGLLPQLQSSGPMIDVLSALQQVKHISDTFLTERINQAFGYNNHNKDSTQHDADAHEKLEEEEDTKVKKMRIEHEGSAMEE